MIPNHHSPISEDLILLSQLLEPVFYYDIFSYPLRIEEILNYSSLSKANKLNVTKVEEVLGKLVEQGGLVCQDGYYMLKEHPEWVQQRIENNQRAESFLKKAKQMTRLMTFFPFVRAVFISGSLSKNVMPEDGDIDYFIVAQPNRLWICRTFLILFKKIFLLNSKKYFCVNYFVAEDVLEIEEKNRFTATEVVTLLPLYGKTIYQQFWQENQWVDQYYPNVQQRNIDAMKPQKRTLCQVLLEPFFSWKIGDCLDRYFMKKTIQHWQKKFGDLDQKDFDIAMKSRRNVSKHHPQMFQQRVVKAFEERVSNFEKEHSLSLVINVST